jgi:NADH-quinone oxidoreductase subunit G
MIMELLLLNHPLDCPVCDQAGECGLQDYSYHHGQAVHRFVEERVVNPQKDVSDLIQLNQDRCIMCTRCVRFTREITQTAELQVMRRGNHAEIQVFPGVSLDDNPMAGNVVDVCPVGALLDKDSLHKQRVWFLSKHESVCTHCSTGCNISVEENKGRIWRIKPRNNPHVNDYWICDEGRYGYKPANDPALLSAMYVKNGNDHAAVPSDEALKAVDRGLKQAVAEGKTIAGVLSPFLTVEEAFLMARYLRELSASSVLALGPVPSRGEDRTFKPDMTNGRSGDTSFLAPKPFTIHAEKAPNAKGVRAVLEHFQGSVIEFDELTRLASAGEFAALYVASGATGEPWIDEATTALLRDKVGFLVLQDVTVTPLAHQSDVVLAGATFAEKAGSYVNADGRLQYAGAALPPRDGSLPDLDLFAILLNRPGGPVRSAEVLAEVAASIPAFAAAGGGKLPAMGVALGEAAEGAKPEQPAFVDAWFVPMGAARSR